MHSHLCIVTVPEQKYYFNKRHRERGGIGEKEKGKRETKKGKEKEGKENGMWEQFL